jgi:hypothetical protein
MWAWCPFNPPISQWETIGLSIDAMLLKVSATNYFERCDWMIHCARNKSVGSTVLRYLLSSAPNKIIHLTVAVPIVRRMSSLECGAVWLL